MQVFQKKGFTLVELMVVVVILGVLGAVGMVSYTSYLGGSRDSNRLTQLSDIRSGLNVYAINKNLPTPEDKVDVLANANIVAYQGYAGEKTLRLIGYSDGGTDPLDGSFFTYYLTKNKKDFQLMGFLEEESALQSAVIPQTYADDIDYSERIPTVTGKKLGALVESGTNTPIQEIPSLTSGLDIATTGTTYNAYYTDQDVISGTGSQLIQSVSNQNCNRILELGNSIGSGIYKISPTGNGVVQVYCDMETDGGGWTIAVNNDNSDDESLTGDCKPRLSGYASHVCGSVGTTTDFTANVGGIRYTDIVFAAYENSFSNIKTYQYMKWDNTQILPTTETYDMPEATSSRDNLLNEYSGLTALSCDGWNTNQLFLSLQNGSGSFEPHTAFSGDTSYDNYELSFVDATNSAWQNTYGLDDYQDGQGCSDLWSAKAYRGYSSYIMLR